MSISGVGGPYDPQALYNQHGVSSSSSSSEQQMQAALFAILSALAEASSNALNEGMMPQLKWAQFWGNSSSAIYAVLSQSPGSISNQTMTQFLQGILKWESMSQTQKNQFPPNIQDTMNQICSNPNIQTLVQQLQQLSQLEQQSPVPYAQIDALLNTIKTQTLPALQATNPTNETLLSDAQQLVNYGQGEMQITSNMAMLFVNQIKMLAQDMSNFASMLNDAITQSAKKAI